MSGWRTRSCGITAAVATAATLAACGAAQSTTASSHSRAYPVAVATASFPASQTVAGRTHLVIAVRNAGAHPIPDVAVTICNTSCAYPSPAAGGTATPPFATMSDEAFLARPSKAVWIVDRPPGACTYSCLSGGSGGAVTYANNTWALGRLAPGGTARFDWALTPARTGHYTVAWQVSAGLTAGARAVVAGGGGTPAGTFAVDVGNTPPQTYVDNNGQIVNAP